jgi:hypothetical protein
MHYQLSINKFMSDENSLDSVDSLINQLKSIPKATKEINHISDELTKENLEEFILKHTGNLVKQASESVSLVRDYVEAAPNAEEVTALAELIKATSSAVESLNRILITDKKTSTAIKIKEMDNKSRQKELDAVVGLRLRSTREELMKQLINATVVEEVKPQLDNISYDEEICADTKPAGVLLDTKPWNQSGV